MSKLRALVDVYRNKLQENIQNQKQKLKSLARKGVTKPFTSTTTLPTHRLLKAKTQAHLRTRRIPQFNHKPLATTLDHTKFVQILKRSRSFVQQNRARYKSSIHKQSINQHLPNLKFKRIDLNTQQSNQNTLSKSHNKINYSVSLKSRNVDIVELKHKIRQSFNRKKRIICVVYKCGRIFKHGFVSSDIPAQNSQNNFMRQSFKSFQENIYDEFFLNKSRPFYLFNMAGSPITKLNQISSNTYIVLLSIHPFFEEFNELEYNKLMHLKNSMIAAHWDSGVPLEQMIEKAANKRLLRHDYLKNYTAEQNPMLHPKKTFNQLQLQKIGSIYQSIDSHNQQKSPQYEIKQTIGKDIFFRSTQKKKDFSKQDVKLIKNLSLQFQKRPKITLSRPSVQYPLTHRDLIRKKYSSHDFILDTKFNRQQLLQLKSIYDSLVSLSIRNYSNKADVMRYGLDKETFIEGIKLFGFQTSNSLLRDILGKQQFVNWKKYLNVMQSLVHKQSDGALDEYLNSLKFNSQFGDISELNFEELLKIVKYGLERLLLYKDSFYDGYEQIITKNIFNHLGLEYNQSIKIEELKKLAGNANFKHIFLS